MPIPYFQSTIDKGVMEDVETVRAVSSFIHSIASSSTTGRRSGGGRASNMPGRKTTANCYLEFI